MILRLKPEHFLVLLVLVMNMLVVIFEPLLLLFRGTRLL